MGSNSAAASSGLEVADDMAVPLDRPAAEQAANAPEHRLERQPCLYSVPGEGKPAGGEDVTLLTIVGVAVRGWFERRRQVHRVGATQPGSDRRKEDLLASRAVK